MRGDARDREASRHAHGTGFTLDLMGDGAGRWLDGENKLGRNGGAVREVGHEKKRGRERASKGERVRR